MADEPTIKDIASIVRKNPALMITVGVALLALVYYLYKKSQANAAAATGIPTAPTPASATGSYTYVENIHQTPAGTVTPAPAPVPVPVPTPGPGPKPKPKPQPGPGPKIFKQPAVHYSGVSPWNQMPPPGVSAATWNPYQYSTIPVSSQWPRPAWYVKAVANYRGGVFGPNN